MSLRVILAPPVNTLSSDIVNGVVNPVNTFLHTNDSSLFAAVGLVDCIIADDAGALFTKLNLASVMALKNHTHDACTRKFPLLVEDGTVTETTVTVTVAVDAMLATYE
jgi:hypothetical protein